MCGTGPESRVGEHLRHTGGPPLDEICRFVRMMGSTRGGAL